VVNDIDLDDVFMYIDRTSSKIGQQYLYYKLRNYKPDKQIRRLKKVFYTNPNLRQNIQIQFSGLNHRKAFELEKLFHTDFVKPKFARYYKILVFITLFILFFSILNKYFLLLLIPVFLINSVLHYKNKIYTSYFIDGIVQMLKAYKIAKEVIKQREIANVFDDDTFLKKIEELKRKSNFILLGEKLNHPTLIVFWLLFEIVKIVFNLEGLVFYSLMDHIEYNKLSIESLFVFIGKIDTAISIIGVERKNQTCSPDFVNEKRLHFVKMYHPLIENCIKNDLLLTEKSFLLTGSNMSGKTTFIRAVALNAILGKSLDFCFAEKFEIPDLKKVMTSIRVNDDLLENKSYYLQEVLKIKEIIKASEDKDNYYLFVLDEILKGTNTQERIAAAKAILSYIDSSHHIVLVSTHDIELVNLLKNRYELYHFNEHIVDNRLYFDYKIKKGAVATGNAIKILELYEFPSEIIKDALLVRKNFIEDK